MYIPTADSVPIPIPLSEDVPPVANMLSQAQCAQHTLAEVAMRRIRERDASDGIERRIAATSLDAPMTPLSTSYIPVGCERPPCAASSNARSQALHPSTLLTAALLTSLSAIILPRETPSVTVSHSVPPHAQGDSSWHPDWFTPSRLRAVTTGAPNDVSSTDGLVSGAHPQLHIGRARTQIHSTPSIMLIKSQLEQRGGMCCASPPAAARRFCSCRCNADG